MTSRVRVLCCVAVRRAVTTQSHVARLTRAQMDPLTSNLHALVALALLWMFDGCNRFDMSTSLCRHALILRYSIILCPWHNCRSINSHPSYYCRKRRHTWKQISQPSQECSNSTRISSAKPSLTSSLNTGFASRVLIRIILSGYSAICSLIEAVHSTFSVLTGTRRGA